MNIQGSNLSMIRGDTETLLISCQTQEGLPRPFVQGDTVTLTVAEEIDLSPLLCKTVTTFTQDGAAQFDFTHTDTNDLLPGRYCYDVQLDTAQGEVKTIVPPSFFEIGGDVTRA